MYDGRRRLQRQGLGMEASRMPRKLFDARLASWHEESARPLTEVIVYCGRRDWDDLDLPVSYLSSLFSSLSAGRVIVPVASW
jgi:hypothetical protein